MFYPRNGSLKIPKKRFSLKDPVEKKCSSSILWLLYTLQSLHKQVVVAKCPQNCIAHAKIFRKSGRNAVGFLSSNRFFWFLFLRGLFLNSHSLLDRVIHEMSYLDPDHLLPWSSIESTSKLLPSCPTPSTHVPMTLSQGRVSALKLKRSFSLDLYEGSSRWCRVSWWMWWRIASRTPTRTPMKKKKIEDDPSWHVFHLDALRAHNTNMSGWPSANVSPLPQ